MTETNSWERFFDAHAPIYEDEVDFLIEELALPPGSSILDVGCGTGRHSSQLAKRGFAVTGLDLSTEMLAGAAGEGPLHRSQRGPHAPPASEQGRGRRPRAGGPGLVVALAG
ncbi:MAG: methyltransferase domain-containing protein [Elusimicrobia bacterium]|nr:methyltransferase domain-containing protein [Elusimicrobiota bacterium]